MAKKYTALITPNKRPFGGIRLQRAGNKHVHGPGVYWGVMGGPPVSCSYTLNVGDSGADVYGYLRGSYGTMTPDTNIEGDIIYEFTVDATGKVVNSYGLTGDDFPTDGVVAFESIIADDITVLMQWNETETAYIGQSTELYDHFSASVDADVCIDGITTSDIAFLGASYHRSDFHLSQRTFGTPPATATHAAAIWSPDKDGTLTEFAVNEPVWNGARVEAGSLYYADDGAGTLLPEQPWLALNGFTDAGGLTPSADVVYTYAAANHDNAGDSYEADYKLSDEGQVLLSLGGVPFLFTEGQAGGTNLISGTTWTKQDSAGSVSTISNNTASTLTLDVTTGSTSYPVTHIPSSSSATDENYYLIFNAHIVSGTPKISRLYNGVAYSMEYTISEGENRIPFGSGNGSYTLFMISWGSPEAAAFHIEVTNIKVVEELAAKQVTLTDGTNSCSTPVVSAEPHIIATYNATDGMTLDVDGVTATCPYDGTLGAGDIVIGCTHRELIRRKPAVVV